MPASSLDQAQVAPWLSDLRFEPFLLACDADHGRAVDLYIWNSELAGACLEVVAHVEVLLRNAVHTQIKGARPPNALRSWLLDPGLLGTDELTRVEETIATIKRRRHVPTEDRVVAGLTFGFWARIFGKRYEELWRQTLHFAFPNGDGTRNQIAGLTNRIVQIRNRIAHHEALFNQPVADRHADMLALASTVDVRARRWVESCSRVSAVLGRRP